MAAIFGRTLSGEIDTGAVLLSRSIEAKKFRVVLEYDEDDAWRDRGWQQFEAASVPEDVIYERLTDEARGGIATVAESGT
ncbi:MAG TPA: hypothetical protein VK752_28210 [Bryobacteraceae bacterium]|nr:hypothetical protein [Bryobacteraceae bacterium]